MNDSGAGFVMLIIIALLAINSIICYNVAKNKNRDASYWAILGVVIPIPALIIVLCIKKKTVFEDETARK